MTGIATGSSTIGLMLSLNMLLSGCLGFDTGEPPVLLPQSWTFSLGSANFSASATLSLMGEGESVGPDLGLHPAQFYALNETLPAGGSTARIEKTIAVSKNGNQILATYTRCTIFRKTDGNDLECVPSEKLDLPVSETALFFGAPIVLPYIPPKSGSFTVPIWDMGERLEVPFLLEMRGNQRIVQVEKRMVEHGYLDSYGGSSGDILDCDVFLQDTLIFEQGKVTCQEFRKTWSWTVDLPIPVGHAAWPADKFKAPLDPVTVTNGIPLGTEQSAFPIQDALEEARRTVPSAARIMEGADWRVGDFSFGLSGRQTTGPVVCDNLFWKIGLVGTAGDQAHVRVNRRTCVTPVVHQDTAVEEQATGPALWPSANGMVRLDGASAAVAQQYLCLDDLTFPIRYKMFTRGFTGVNQTWLILSHHSGQSVVLSGASGFLYNLSGGDGGALDSLFKHGAARQCPPA